MSPRPRKPTRAEAREARRARALAVAVPSRADVVVVGGGAAGLVAGIAAAEADASAVVLERDLACGRTVLATGNGRCNFSNEDLSWERYRNPAFVREVCGERFGADVLTFFEGCGLAWEGEDGRLYPRSRQAASVRDALLARAGRAGVVLAPARAVDRVEKAEGSWRASWDGGSCEGRSLVLAAGGGAGIVRGLGLPLVEGRPVLCPLACEAASGIAPGALDGRRARVRARLLRGGREVAAAQGEVLFRGYGLSGIVVFDLSRRARPGDVVCLDLTDGLDPARARALADAAGGLFGLLDPAVAEVLGGSLDLARDLRFVVRGPAEPERAQVTRGGLATEGFDPATLGARDLPGLFAAGEALDVDADCGGFNLAWAWKSGLVAGASAAARALGERRRPC